MYVIAVNKNVGTVVHKQHSATPHQLCSWTFRGRKILFGPLCLKN